MLSRLSRLVLAHRRLVAVFWLVVTVAGMLTVGTTFDRLSTKFSVTGREGFDTSQRILNLYGNGGISLPVVPVVTLPQGTTVDTPGVVSELAKLDALILSTAPKAADGSPAVRLASYASTRDRTFVSHDGRTTYAMVFVRLTGVTLPPEETALRTVVNNATIDGAPVRLTGYQELDDPTGNGGGGPGVLVEALIGGVGALAVLAFVFASFIAFFPVMIAVVSIMSTFLIILGLTAFAEVSFIIQFLVALIGLGVAIDYSLIIVTRWREEKANGLDNEAAVTKAMETAGRAVIFSGTTVGIGLLALVVLPIPFLRSVGYAGMLIPVVSVVVSLTLLPVMLATQDRTKPFPWRRDYPHWAARGLLFLPQTVSTAFCHADWPRVRKEAHASRGWVAWARAVVRRRWIAAAGALLLLGALLVPAVHLTVGSPKADTLAQSGPAKEGLVMLESSGIGTGPMSPFEVLVAAGADAREVATAAARVHDMYGAVAPGTGGDPTWNRAGTTIVEAVSTLDGDTPQGRDQVTDIRTAVQAGGTPATVGGASAESADFVSAVYGNFPLMVGLVIVVTFILLARAFRSLLLPLKAVILNVLSVGGAYGLLVVIWQDGHGSSQIFGVQATGAITEFIPLMVFAFLFGLSMDYEVFILSRMREEYDRTGSTDLAVVRGIGRTGRLVTCAALILFLAFLALASGPEVTLKIFATGLATGIMLDATVVRALLVPALVSLFGRWNWWLPSWPARLMRVQPSKPGPEGTRREILPQEA